MGILAVRSWRFQSVKSDITGVFVVFASGTGSVAQEIVREPRAGPRHKVPAPQANGVAARLRPPPGSGAGMMDSRHGWLRSGMKWRRNHGVAAKGEDDADF